MQNNQEQGTIKFPKRRKSKDNPYSIGYDQQEKSYFLTFTNGSGIMQQIYIGKTMYEIFNSFELDDLSQLNEQERHMDTSELTEEYLYKNLSHQSHVIEEEVERKMMWEILKEAIKSLSLTQRRWLILYYFENFTYEQIAEIEGCKYQSVQDAIKLSEEKIKKFFKK